MDIKKVTKTSKQDDGSTVNEDLDVEQMSREAQDLFKQRGRIEIQNADEAMKTFCAALDDTTPHSMLIAIAGFAEDDTLSSAATKNPNADAAVLLARQKVLLTKAQNAEDKVQD